MEDTHIEHICPRGTRAFVAVYDGHGGPNASLYASQHLHHRVLLAIDAVDTSAATATVTEKVKETLISTFLQVDREYIAHAMKPEVKYHPRDGTTAVTLLILGRSLFCANLGDSRAVCRMGKQAVPLSRDHVPNEPDERERIIAGGMTVRNGRINGNMVNVSRGFGDFFYKNPSLPQDKTCVVALPEIKVIEDVVKDNVDIVILASDGLWDVLTNKEAIEIAGKYLPALDAQAAADDLVKIAYNKHSSDNITATVIFFPPKATAKL
jgi:serine/threonine protein phosphatase PrpC